MVLGKLYTRIQRAGKRIKVFNGAAHESHPFAGPGPISSREEKSGADFGLGFWKKWTRIKEPRGRRPGTDEEPVFVCLVGSFIKVMKRIFCMRM